MLLSTDGDILNFEPRSISFDNCLVDTRAQGGRMVATIENHSAYVHIGSQEGRFAEDSCTFVILHNIKKGNGQLQPDSKAFGN